VSTRRRKTNTTTRKCGKVGKKLPGGLCGLPGILRFWRAKAMSIHCTRIQLVPTRAAGYPHRADGDEKVLREAETELVDMVLKEDRQARPKWAREEDELCKFVKIDDQGSIELISAIGKGVRFRNRESVKNVLEFVEKLFDEMQEGDNENQN
jgi:hypothetical protein